MAHALFRERMAYVGEQPWHRLGRQVAAGTSSADFLEAAGLDWKVELVPASGAKRLPPTKTHPGERWTRYQIQRPPLDNEQMPVAFGMVGDRYVPLQNTEAFAFFDPLLEQGWASLETAGALHDGQVVWVQVRLRDNIEVRPGDQIERYLLLRNRHDGEGAVSIRFSPVRVVCKNTLTFAERSQRAFASIRHSRRMGERLMEVQVDAIKAEVEAFTERTKLVFQAMAEQNLAPADQLKLLDKLCGKPPKAPSPEKPTRREMAEKRLAAQKNDDPSAGSETAWGLYNAITWMEDERARQAKDKEAATNRMWFGSGAESKAAAFDEISAFIEAPG